MNKGLIVPALVALVGCGPAVLRDLMSMPQQRITYDDMCNLQDHFDQRARSGAAAYRAVAEQSNETAREEPDENGQMRRVVLGEGTYAVTARTDRQRLRQLLREEYKRLPHLRLAAEEGEVRIRLGWWQSGSIRRVRPDTEIEVIATDGQSLTLPPHPCIGEFLFGDEPYAMRRNVIEAERARSHGEIPAAYVHDDAATPAVAPDATSASTPSPR